MFRGTHADTNRLKAARAALQPRFPPDCELEELLLEGRALQLLVCAFAQVAAFEQVAVAAHLMAGEEHAAEEAGCPLAFGAEEPVSGVTTGPAGA